MTERSLAGFAMRLILLILLVLVYASAHAADKVAAPDFSKYPQSESFRYFLSAHTNAAWHPQRTNLMVISAFHSGDRSARQYFVTDNGEESDYRDVYYWAIQSSHSKHIAETNLASLRSAIRQLPTESLSPPIERLVIVSFREGTNWITRSYDSQTPPMPMRRIYDIIGEGFETRKDK